MSWWSGVSVPARPSASSDDENEDDYLELARVIQEKERADAPGEEQGEVGSYRVGARAAGRRRLRRFAATHEIRRQHLGEDHVEAEDSVDDHPDAAAEDHHDLPGGYLARQAVEQRL